MIFFVGFEFDSLSLIDKFEYVPKHLIHLLLISASMLTYYLESLDYLAALDREILVCFGFSIVTITWCRSLWNHLQLENLKFVIVYLLSVFIV